ncbi:hypothetical protein RvY_19007-1 [Ramazzottius varieornatus]|uniref:Uncharacterized protein n=1 Tax=Ramazzottius varieornatus TaxID=947166 RepID=A0A1D1WAE0_RAMVA|nr:hypothetical protein RvY_19007-1 [Ramazzottius varieornatus]
MMAFLAVVSAVLNKPRRRKNITSPMYHMDQAIVYYVWSMEFVAIMGAVMHILASVWMSDKAEECLPILRSISVAEDDKKVRIECAEFSRRVRKNPSAVSLLGLCSINRPYITAV